MRMFCRLLSMVQKPGKEPWPRISPNTHIVSFCILLENSSLYIVDSYQNGKYAQPVALLVSYPGDL